MNKRLSILFIFMLIFQTISSSLFLPSQIVAEGSEHSVFTGISFTDEDGKAINMHDVEDESAVNVHVDWSIAHVEVEAEYSESLSLPEKLHLEEEQHGALTDGETEVGTYQAELDGAVTVTFNDEVDEHEQADGTFVILAASSMVEDGEGSSENAGSASKTDAVKAEDDGESANEETDGTEEEVEHNLFAGNEEQAQQITENIIDDINLIREDGSEYEEGDLLKLDENLSLELDWSLSNSHEYQSGATFEFQLPEALNIYNEFGGDLDGYGTYYVTTNGEVTFTFNERIENESEINGMFWMETELNEHVVQRSTEQLEFVFNDEVIERIMINVRPESGQAIQKNGQPVDGSFNTEEIEWTVILNTTREDLENAAVTDPILDGQELILDSIDLQEVEVNMQGQVVEIIEGDVSFENRSTLEKLVLELGDTNKAYQLTFRTSMKQEERDKEGWTTYANTAYLNSEGKEQVQAGASVSVERPESLTKSSSDFDAETRSVEWEINANFTEKELSAGTEIVDEFTFTVGDEERNDVFEITEQNIDIRQVERFGENGEVEETSDANELFSISIDGNQVTYALNEASNNAFIITYSTTARDDAYITHDGTIANTVEIDGETTTSSQGVGQQVGVKSHSGVNYEDKTIDWTITVNADSQSLNNFVLADNFSGSGQKLVDGSIEIEPEATNAEIIPHEDGEGFAINFGDINEPHTVSYSTEFTYDFSDDDHRYFMNWVDVEYETDNGVAYDLEFDAGVTPNQETWSNGAKNSWVNNETKEITWMVDINYNQLTLEDAKLIDEIPDNQSLVDGTVEIYPTTIAPNGDIHVGENAVDDFNVEATENEIIVNFDEIDQSYRVVFVTEDKDGIYNIDEVYTNTAEFIPRGGQVHELTANATLPNQGAFIGKTGEHNMDDWTIDWELTVNESRSMLNEVTVTDDLGDVSLQILLEDTIEVTNVDTAEELVAGEDYQVNVEGNAFSVTFLEVITDAYSVTYSSYIVAEESANMDNEAIVETLDDVIVGHVDAEETVEVRMSTGGGTGEGTTGELVLEKLETDTDRSLDDVAFTLIREVGNQEIVVREDTTDENGQIHWTGLQFGEYTLEEVIPEGYLGEEFQVIELSFDAPEGIQTIPIYNERQTGTAAIKKVDAVTGDELESAVFEITNLVTGQTYTLTTDEDGTVSEEVPFGEYTVEEITSPDGYRITEDIENIIVEIDETASIEVPNEAIVEVSGHKTWITDEDEELLDTITVELLGNGTKIDDTQVSAVTNWEYTFRNLDKYDENGQDIEYSIEEVEVNGYISQINGFDLTNIQTVDISGEKNWIEVDDQYRPDSITINLLADGEEVHSQEIEANDENEWTFTFENVAKFDADGNEIYYTVEEADMAGYTSEVEAYTITNTQETTELSGTKTWLDDDSEDRPEAITVQVKNGETVVQEQEVTADDDWSYTFTDLPQYDKEGNEIVYTVDEVDVEEGYEKSVQGNDITNLRVGTTEVEVTKLWKDEDENDRPDSITINLLQNNAFHSEYEVTAENGWELTIPDLPQYDEDGVEYDYAVSEHDIAGYDSAVEGFEITNTRADEKSIEITKSWLDGESEERPDSIEVELYRSVADGELESFDAYTITAVNNWSIEIADLAAFNENGKAYTYTIEEVPVDGYESSIHGFDIINLRVGTTAVEGEKTWLDNDADSRPDSITVHLLQNGEIIDTVEVTAETDWTYSFEDLAVYDAEGVVYEYTVEEEPVEGYESKVVGYDIINTLISEEEEVTTPVLDKPADADKGHTGDRLPDTATIIYNIILIGAGLFMIGLTLTLIYRKRKEV